MNSKSHSRNENPIYGTYTVPSKHERTQNLNQKSSFKKSLRDLSNSQKRKHRKQTQSLYLSAMKNPNGVLQNISKKSLHDLCPQSITEDSHERLPSLNLPQISKTQQRSVNRSPMYIHRNLRQLSNESIDEKRSNNITFVHKNSVVNTHQDHSLKTSNLEKRRRSEQPMTFGRGKHSQLTLNDIQQLEENLDIEQLQRLQENYPQLKIRKRDLQRAQNDPRGNFIQHNKSDLHGINSIKRNESKIRTVNNSAIKDYNDISLIEIDKLKNHQSEQKSPKISRNNTFEKWEVQQPTDYVSMPSIQSGVRFIKAPELDHNNEQILYEEVGAMSSIQQCDDDNYIDITQQSEIQNIKLPKINKKNKNDTQRFIISEKTKKEFGLRDRDIPDSMKQVLPHGTDYTNHVTQNKKITKNLNEINKVLYLSKIKLGIDQNIQVNSKKQLVQQIRRQHFEQKVKKWDDFKIRREIEIDKYIAAKKIQRNMEQIRHQVHMLQIVKHLRSQIELVKQLRIEAHYKALVLFRFMNRFLWKIKKYGGIQARMRQRVRFCFTLQHQCFIVRKEQMESEAKNMILTILRDRTRNNDFRKLLRQLFKLILFMQNKFHNRFIFKEAKLQLLMRSWDKRLYETRKIAEQKQNPQMLTLCDRIDKVDPEIKKYVCQQFQHQVEKLSWIFFYNNRKLDRADFCDEVEINLQVAKIQHWIREQFKLARKDDLLTAYTLEIGKIDPETMEQFGIRENDDAEQENQPEFIDSFIEIFWVDPFGVNTRKPKIKFKKKKQRKAMKLWEIAADMKRIKDMGFIEQLDEMPVKRINLFQFPSYKLMMNIMRATIGVRRIEDLWMYHPDY